MFHRSCQHTSVCRADEVDSCMIAPVCHFAGCIQQPARPSPRLHATLLCLDASLVPLFTLERNGHTFSYKYPESNIGNFWPSVNHWLYSKVWQAVSMGCSRWKSKNSYMTHYFHVEGTSKENFSLGLLHGNSTSWVAPPVIEISAHCLPSSLRGCHLI